jgi:hypothetical protein
MECEKCGTWNPDDKIRCWRCNAELPRPPEPKKQSRINRQTWMWILVAIFILVTTLFRCNAFDLGGAEGTGYLPPLSESAPLVWTPGSAADVESLRVAHAPMPALPISVGHSTMSDIGLVES